MGLKSRDGAGVKSFLIQHSLPRFPLNSSRGMFDTNITNRSQHFVCISMYDRFETALSSTDLSQFSETNFYKIFSKYLKPIKPAFNHVALFSKTFGNICSRLYKIPCDHEDTKSFSIQSTGDPHRQLTFQIFAKTSRNTIDLYDDVTASLSIHHEDYKLNAAQDFIKTGNIQKKTAILMIAQSHTDPATLGINQRTLVDRLDFYATVHILNSFSVSLPKEGGGVKEQFSMYRDHSKWSINVIYGHEGSFPALLCFYDLNRSNKQAERGGGVFCLNSTLTGPSLASIKLWKLFMSFQPQPTNMARFRNTDIDVILDQVIGKAPAIETVHSVHKSVDPFHTPPVHRERLSHEPSARFSSGSENKDNDLILLFPFLTPEPEEFTVKCPYKYRKVEQALQKQSYETIPTKIALAIHQNTIDYGIENINTALNQYKLVLNKFDNPDISTPAKVSRHFTEFMPSTVLVPRSSEKRNMYDYDPILNMTLHNGGGTGPKAKRSTKSFKHHSSSLTRSEKINFGSFSDSSHSAWESESSASDCSP